jgi:hypothetical protein
LFGRHEHRIFEFRYQAQAWLTHITFCRSYEGDRIASGSLSISSQRSEVSGFMVVVENNGVF